VKKGGHVRLAKRSKGIKKEKQQSNLFFPHPALGVDMEMPNTGKSKKRTLCSKEK
jgi:hypothetical protein